jgi:hypothetical protein
MLSIFFINNMFFIIESYEIIDGRDENVFIIFIHIMISKQWGPKFMDGFPGTRKGLFCIHKRL